MAVLSGFFTPREARRGAGSVSQPHQGEQMKKRQEVFFPFFFTMERRESSSYTHSRRALMDCKVLSILWPISVCMDIDTFLVRMKNDWYAYAVRANMGAKSLEPKLKVGVSFSFQICVAVG